MAGPEGGEKGVAGEKGGRKRCFGVSEGRCFGGRDTHEYPGRRIPEGNLGIGWDSWCQILNGEHSLPARLAKNLIGNFLAAVSVAVRALRAVSEGFENQDAPIAKRDFRGLPSRALVKPVGTRFIIVRHSLARRQRSLRALVSSLDSPPGG